VFAFFDLQVVYVGNDLNFVISVFRLVDDNVIQYFVEFQRRFE